MAVTTARKAAVPKAGPKKRAAKAEEAALRAAIEENRKRGSIKVSRKASKVHSYSYKQPDEAAKRRKATAYLREMERVFGMRTPKFENEFLAFHDGLKDDEVPHAVALFKMECPHTKNEVLASRSSISQEDDKRYIACERCGYVRLEDTSKKRMLAAEWNTYCPDAYDMFDWSDMFTTDKSLWRYIFDEARAELVERSLTEEV